MRAWHLPAFGSIDALRLVDVPDPAPAAGEVVLRLRFAALNPADRYLAEGQYPARPALPHTLGRDGIGEVIAVGADVAGVRVGDVKAIARGETGVNRPGTFAGRVAVAADALIDVPAGWSDEQAAGASLVYLTAYQAITQWNDVPDDAVTLVTGATGGVGVAATQLAKAIGHTVVGLSRSPEKSATLRALGADHTFDSADADWPKRLAAALGRKVDLVVENISGPGFNALPGVMAQHGRISVVGQLAGPVPQFSPASLFFKRLRIGGVSVGAYGRDEATAAWGAIVALLARTDARPLVDRVFAFEQLPQAFARLREGPMGKVLLRVAG